MADRALARLRLARTSRIGPVSWRSLVARFGSAERAVEALPDLMQRQGRPAFKPYDAARAEREIADVAALGARHIFVDDADYPPLLRELNSAPPVLIASGRLELAAQRGIAMVGARNASAAACRFARQLAADLADRGLVVVSGLARGIDTAAHLGAMNGGTVAVIASGIDVSFPPENRALQRQIAAEQLLLTEYPPGTEPLARQFPHRNRIIAGLSLGTVVVEAAPKSGSLLTARMAGDAGREVMAVPGSPLDPRARGCNHLIREGATLVQDADDICEAIGTLDARMTRAAPPPELPLSAPREPDDAERAALIAMLGPVPVAVDELVRQSGIAAPIVQMLLTELELAARIERHAGARVAIVS